jgi:8-oxo-dGTP pyrophosphatase MutT (NUDIX family)
VPTVEHIARRLAASAAHTRDPDPLARQAAVAIILRERLVPPPSGELATDVLFIRRAEKEGDPWSGHMAFPGGHRDPEDASLLIAAIRETREEIGVDLERDGVFLGSLEPHVVQPRLRPIGMYIAPYVFRLDHERTFHLSAEVAEVVWTPLAPIVSGRNHTEESRIIEGATVVFGGYRIAGGHFVWGLTYRMLHAFFGVLDPEWRAPRPEET